MTARKKVISTICIISLILAITVGVLLSVGAESIDNRYVGESVRLSNTSAFAKPQSYVKPDADSIPEDAVEITSADDLKAFLKGEEGFNVNYGYISAEELNFDWGHVGAQTAFLAGRTLDGNGCKINLSNTSSTNSAKIVGFTNGDSDDPLQSDIGCDKNNYKKRNYGMFVDYNMGTIKNITFVYSQTNHSVTADNSVRGKNFAGIICGSNSGTIANCDLIANGKFGHSHTTSNMNTNSYDNGSDPKEAARTYFGGIAGRNGGTITNITAKYSNFEATIYVNAQNKTSGIGGGDRRADAIAVAGGIAGTMFSNDSECSNIFIQADSDVSYVLTADRRNQGGLSSKKSTAMRIVAAVVPSNSEYSKALGGIGNTPETQAKVDNIFVDFNATIDGDGMGYDVEGTGQTIEFSQYAVVFCGKSTNVTALKKEGDNFNTSHCPCNGEGTSGGHSKGHVNLVDANEYSEITVSFEQNSLNQFDQVITLSPKDEHDILGGIKFGKFDGNNASDSTDYTENYPNVPANDSDFVVLYNQANVRRGSYSITVSPYKADAPTNYWTVDGYCYQVVDIVKTIAPMFTYNGNDFLKSDFTYTPLAGGNSVAVNINNTNKTFTRKASADATATAAATATLPGEYYLKLSKMEDEFFYIDHTNKIISFAGEDEELEYTFTIDKAQMQIVDVNYEELQNQWFNSTQTFTFALTGTGNAADAVDGYYIGKTRYRSLTIEHDIADTDGTEFTVYLSKGSDQVTYPITYTIKMDRTKPVAELSYEDITEDIWYDHNVVAIDANDATSGLDSITVTTAGGTVDIMAVCAGEEGHGNSYVKDGVYYWYFNEVPTGPIVITDVAGNSIQKNIEVNINVDYQPTLTVEKVYYKDSEGQTDYTYDSENPISRKVYVQLNSEFGVSGGKVMYKYADEEDWSDFDNSKDFVVLRSGEISFKAVSNTYGHNEGMEYVAFETVAETTVSVNIELDDVVIAKAYLTVTGADEGISKTFDGNNSCDGVTVSLDSTSFLADNPDLFEGEVTFTFSVKYSSINAGNDIDLIVEVNCSDETKHVTLDPEFALTGTINKKDITVTISNAQKTWGEDLPEFKYNVAAGNMIEGFEEDIELYVDVPDGYTEKTLAGGAHTIYAKNELLNYNIKNVTNGTLTVDRLKVDRFVYNNGTFTNIDTKNIKTREFEVGFKGYDGNKVEVAVKICDASGEEIDVNAVSAGIYDVVLSVKNEKMAEIYELIDDVTSFKIRIIDASLFEVKEEVKEPEKQEPVEKPEDKEEVDQNEEQNAPAVNNSAPAQVGIYEDGSASTNNTDTTIEAVQQKKDYLAMISIFCAVAIMIAFAIGVGRAITKRIRH
ncbi:MAG: hypothetical protein K2M75_05740 [Clostridia bacterium]|nr:hypothetical protein [Clostridia bacterium]